VECGRRRESGEYVGGECEKLGCVKEGVERVSLRKNVGGCEWEMEKGRRCVGVRGCVRECER
jgi:hypothetical protein